MSGSPAKRDLISEASKVLSSLKDVFPKEKRDQQTIHILEEVKSLIEALIHENERMPSEIKETRQNPTQLWLELENMKSVNKNLQREVHALKTASRNTVRTQESGDVILIDPLKTQREKEDLRATELQNSNEHEPGLDTASKLLATKRKDSHNLISAETENASLKQKLPNSAKQPDYKMTENINERSRPSVIAMRYSTLESQEWMDAKECLEASTQMNEEEITRFLCLVIMETYKASCNMYHLLEITISNLMRRPALAINTVQSREPAESTPLPGKMMDAIRTQLRASSDHFDVTDLEKLTKSSLQKQFKVISDLDIHTAVNSYLHQSARLTWQMVIQQPPMIMSVADDKYNEEHHKLWWSCDQERASNVHHFIWPVLYDYADGNLMVKGCVFTG